MCYPMSVCADLVMSCMDELVESVNETRRICKDLLNQGLLSEDIHRTIVAAPSTQDRMKQLLQALSSKGQQGRNALYRLLQEHEPELTLQLGMLHKKLTFHIVFLMVLSFLMGFLSTFSLYLAIDYFFHSPYPYTPKHCC